MRTAEIRTTDGEVKLVQRADEPDRIVGYAAVFYREGVPGTEYELFDGLVERIDPGAFGRALAERDDARALFNHDTDNLLARVGSDTLNLWADERGLGYEFEVDPADADHSRVVRKIERRDLSGSSFSFIVDSQRFDTQEEGPDIRTILSVELFDVGPVTFPAYEATTVGTRDANGLQEAYAAWQTWKTSGDPGAKQAALKRFREIELDRIRRIPR